MTDKIELIPAIMPQNLDDLAGKVNLVNGLVTTVQLDFMDGKYVPEADWPFSDKDFFDRNEEIELPHWDDIDYELDLMVEEPEKYLEMWLKFSPARIIFHYASIRDFKKIEEFVKQVSGFIEIGFAIQYKDDLDEVIEKIKNGVGEFIQCMGIEKIGYQGEPFDKRIFETIKKIRKLIPDLPISIDGGANEENIRELIGAGVTRIVSGSTIFANNALKENIEKIKSLF